MARPSKRYRISVRGSQRSDVDADLLMQALLIMAEEARQDLEPEEKSTAGALRSEPSKGQRR